MVGGRPVRERPPEVSQSCTVCNCFIERTAPSRSCPDVACFRHEKGRRRCLTSAEVANFSTRQTRFSSAWLASQDSNLEEGFYPLGGLSEVSVICTACQFLFLR